MNTRHILVQCASEGELRCMPATAELQLSAAFSLEQRRVALAIWPPLLQVLRPVLHELTRLDCALTPNGLIIESALGWGLALGCLEGERLPHFIAARDLTSDGAATIKAFLTDEGYNLDAANGSNPRLARVQSPRRSSGA